MPQTVSVSLSKFTASVQAAVKAAVAKHPKFKVEVPNAITVSYLIRGFPVPEAILSAVTVGETQAFATDVAAHVAGAHPEAFGAVGAPAPEAAIISVGRHLIVGFPPMTQIVQIER
jgi:phage tail sheath gpL-like